MFDWLMDVIKQHLLQNEFAIGGMIFMVVGSILGVVYKSLPKLWTLLSRKILVTVDIQSYENPMFKYFSEWLANQKYSKRTKLLTAKVTISNEKTGDTEKNRERLVFSPAPGGHLIFYKGRPVWIYRTRESTSEKGMFWFHEAFDIYMLGRNREILKQMIKDAHEFSSDKEKDKTVIYSNIYSQWEKIAAQPKRSINSVILDNHNEKSVLDDVKDFITKEDWYVSRGIPYKRGYLLHGPPGTGKTSLVRGIASELNCPIYSLNIHSRLDKSELLRLFSSIPKGSILLIEDIDTIDVSSRNNKNEYTMTTGDLLNVIDGVVLSKGILLFVTTNHIEKLDQALTRPGRLDMHIYCDNVSKGQIERMFKLFYPGSNGDAEKFASTVPDKSVSPAKLQEYFISNRTIPACIDNVTKIT